MDISICLIVVRDISALDRTREALLVNHPCLKAKAKNFSKRTKFINNFPFLFFLPPFFNRPVYSNRPSSPPSLGHGFRTEETP
jgi:hypothetical protein